MASAAHVTVTVLDLPAVLELLEDCIEHVPDWEQPWLRQRLDQLIANAVASGFLKPDAPPS